ncbi:hypothetical protein DSO57_1002429 [Entomophthora muscae]|uniref:Uncharacterized protein n=1 Tax=Entomophthora muscae TaxID=34485 RepID=A0ACC2SAK9_9FUNG|nr:hypothetical protein DSO57_1002429 [Entomophthora muscae]
MAQANQSSGGFGYVTFRGQDEDEATFDREFKARDTMRELEFALKERGKAWTVKEMKALIPELLLNIESELEISKNSLASQITRQLKPYEHPGFEIGFVRNVDKFYVVY